MFLNLTYFIVIFSEFISCQWTKKDKETKAPGIMNFISRFNMVSFYQIFIFSPNDSPSKTVRNVFCFIEKAFKIQKDKWK